MANSKDEVRCAYKQANQSIQGFVNLGGIRYTRARLEVVEC